MAERLDMFMARANAAYYARKNPFADFTTAPEIGQVFGELLGAWAAVVWAQMGAPDPVRLVEAGPGRGTLMADARRATVRVAPAFHAACRVHFIETSPRLRAEQVARVPDATWHNELEGVPAGPAIVLANEFLDALPTRQFVWRDAGWRERHVEAGHFIEQDAADSPLLSGEDWLTAPEDGAVVEVGQAARAWVDRLAHRIACAGGAALLLDYGTSQSLPGDSLQALRDGRPDNPLAEPGQADLTTHVDFAALARTARGAGAAIWGPIPQGVFLGRLGLAERTACLVRAHPERATAFFEVSARLAAPDRMGALFKALCLTAPAAPAPPGFAE